MDYTAWPRPGQGRRAGQAVPAPGGYRYRLVLAYEKTGLWKQTGAYNRDGLPAGWDRALAAVKAFLSFYAQGALFDARLYAARGRREGDRMFVGVMFGQSRGVYTYLCNDETVREGDVVADMTHGLNGTVRARVVEVRWLPEAEAPYPMAAIKTVLYKEDQ